MLQGESPAIILTGNLHQEERETIHRVIKSLTHQTSGWVSSLEIAEAVDALPWTAKVSVRRLLNNDIHVEVEVKTIMARVSDDTGITDVGEVIQTGRQTPSHLPTVQGQDLTGSVHRDAPSLKRIRGVLARYGENATVFDKTRQGWVVSMMSGSQVLLGERELEDRLERFLVAFRAFQAANPGINVVADARYNHGVAIKERLIAKENLDSEKETSSSSIALTHETDKED